MLGLLFTYLQMCEYTAAPFAIRDGYYPSVFFTLTGLHGLHVLFGSIFIISLLTRILLGLGFRTRRLHFGCAS